MAAGRIVRTNITQMLPPYQWATLVPANDEDIFQSALPLPVSAVVHVWQSLLDSRVTSEPDCEP